ncbi:HcpA family protein [Solibacillus sp. R5-41]|uniref:tetratricopeptide repeat protein n=1 Tax=Solibacillus sp. R5-41 TaxID=2048654 RepID=UPI000C12733C|nr:tetratricopeptide repeat protein [Solibacillus sp. R5-41]ATP42014.1 HcpA family protein [Solibacillus sp. R5-41]
MWHQKQMFEQLINEQVEPEKVEILKQQFQQALNGNSEAMVEIALFYKRVELFDGMHYWLNAAINHSDSGGFFELANSFFEGLGVEVSEQRAFYYYEQAAKQHHPDAMNNLADMYLNGEGIEIDEGAALAWFLKAATAGVVEAMYTLGIMYEQGIGTEIDEDKAFTYYEMAAKGGDSEGLYRMGMIYFQGELTRNQSYEQAMKWFQCAADIFHVDAIYNIAYCYENALGVEKSSEQAIRYYKQAALLGDGASMLKLAELYEGVRPQEAEKWRQAAQQD